MSDNGSRGNGSGRMPTWFVKLVVGYAITTTLGGLSAIGGFIWWAATISTQVANISQALAVNQKRQDDKIDKVEESLDSLRALHEEDRKVIEDKIANDRRQLDVLLDRQARGVHR